MGVSQSTTENYRERTAQKWNSIAFRAGLAIVLIALIAMQMFILSSLYDEGILSEAITRMTSIYAVMALLLNFLLYREVLNTALFTLIGIYGKNRAYIVGGVVVAITFSTASLMAASSVEFTTSGADMYRKIAVGLGCILGLEVALHGALLKTDVRRLKATLGVTSL